MSQRTSWLELPINVGGQNIDLASPNDISNFNFYVITGSGAIASDNDFTCSAGNYLNSTLTFYYNANCTNAGGTVNICGRQFTDIELAHPQIITCIYDGSAFAVNVTTPNNVGAFDGQFIANASIPSSALTNDPWLIDGNAGTDPLVNFVGTTDNADFIGKRNNIRAWRLAVDETSFGVESGYVTAKHNTYFGSRAGKAGSTGRENVSVGYEALTANTVGNYNTAIGTLASNISTNGDNNTNVGYKSLFNNASGDDNTVVGASSALTITSGGKNTLLGANTDISDATGQSRTALGESAVATKDYQLFLASNITEAEFNKTNLRVGAITNNYTASSAPITATLTPAQVISGLISSTSAAAVTLTMPTGSDLGTALNAAVGTKHTFLVNNTSGSNTVTIAVNTGAILSALANAGGNAAGFGELDIPSGTRGIGEFTIMFTSSTTYCFTRTA